MFIYGLLGVVIVGACVLAVLRSKVSGTSKVRTLTFK
jgi:hypothetical protein